MVSDRRKLIGLLLCVIIGGIILYASIIFSDVDKPVIQGEELTAFGEGWQVETGGKKYTNVVFPAQIKDAVLGNTLILTKSMPENLDSRTYLFFRASHQFVKVYIGDEPVYSFGWGEQRLFGRTPACTWVVIPLSEEQSGESVRIELKGVYQRHAGLINAFYIGEKSAILSAIIEKRLGSVLICLILMVIGAGMIGITAALRNGKVTGSLQRLGFLSVLVGTWSLCVTNILQLLYSNVFALLNLEFFLFNLLMPVFAWFLLSFQHYKDKNWLNRLFWISIAQFMVIEVLQIAGIADYMNSIILTHIMLVAGMACIIGNGIRDLYRKRATREEKMLILSVVMILIFAGIDLVRFYQIDIEDEGFYTRIGTMIFIAIWANEVIRNISKQFVKMAKTEALEVLAYEDLMTSLKNRTAFEKWLNDYENSASNEDAYIVAFDMNNLKKINDSYGHLKGDQAITEIARIIKEAFEPVGVSYRTGGDEICVVLSDAEVISSGKINEILQGIDDTIASASKALNLDLSVAAGYSKASKKQKRDIYQAYREADRRMYQCKQKMKKAKESIHSIKEAENRL